MAYVFGLAVNREEDYYRDDLPAVRRCLAGEIEFKTAFTFVYGPRRSGKTSFMKCVGRHADAAHIPWMYVDFMSTASQLEATADVIRQQSTGLLLLDETYSVMPRVGKAENDEVLRKRAVLFRVLLDVASREPGTLRCIIGEVPMMREALRAEGDALDPVLERSSAYFIEGLSFKESIDLVCQTKTNRDDSLRLAAKTALDEDFVSGLPMEVNRLGEYLTQKGAVDRSAFTTWMMGQQLSYDRMLPDLSEPEQLLIGLAFHQPGTLRLEYLLPDALFEAESLCRFGLCRWVERSDGKTLELRGVALPGKIPTLWKGAPANRPAVELDRETLRAVLTAAGVGRYKGIDEQHRRTEWVIHHISDIHVGRYSSALATGDGARAGGESMLVEYAKHVRALPAPRRPSIAIVSGDLTSTGLRNEWREAKQFLAELRRSLEPLSPTATVATPEQVVVVPGDHDQDWSAFDPSKLGDPKKRLEELERLGSDPDTLFADFRDACEGYITPFEPAAAVYHKDLRLLIVPFNSAVPPSSRELSPEYVRSLSLDDVYSRVVDLKAELGRTPGMPPRIVGPDAEQEANVGFGGGGKASDKKKGTNTRAAGKNVAANEYQSELQFFVRNEVGVLEAKACAVDRMRKLADDAIRKGGGALSETMLKIAVCHHNVHQQDDPLVDLIHAKRFRYALAKEGFSLLLHGHKHLSYLVHERLPGSLTTVAAASLGAVRIEMESVDGSNQRTRPGFNELVIRHDTGSGLRFKVQVTVWEWDEDKRRFQDSSQGEFMLP